MLMDTLRKRRSIRRYEDRKVEKEKIDALLKAALLSPSSRGIRPWEFLVVDDRETLQRLSRAKPHGAGFLAKAAVGIVVLTIPEKSDVWVEDAAIASALMLLMAEDQGLGACWIQIRLREKDGDTDSARYVRQVLDIPDAYDVEAILSAGYPAETKSAYGDADLAVEKLHQNRFGKRYAF